MGSNVLKVNRNEKVLIKWYKKTINSFNKKFTKITSLFKLFSIINKLQTTNEYKLHISVENLFLRNIDLSNGAFKRYDIIFYYIAIKEYYLDKNSRIYLPDSLISKEEFYRYLDNYNENNFIFIDSSENFDSHGAFHIAMSLYRGSSSIYVRYKCNEEFNIKFDEVWLTKNIIPTEIEKVKDCYNSTRKRFYPPTNIILWQPILKHYPTIKTTLEKSALIVKEEDIHFDSIHSFKDFLEDVYCRGEHLFGRVEEKFNRLKNEELVIKMVWLEFNKLELKKDKNHSELFFDEVVRIKKFIRGFYRYRIKNYVFDCLIHASLNTKEIKELNQAYENIKKKNFKAS